MNRRGYNIIEFGAVDNRTVEVTCITPDILLACSTACLVDADRPVSDGRGLRDVRLREDWNWQASSTERFTVSFTNVFDCLCLSGIPCRAKPAPLWYFAAIYLEGVVEACVLQQVLQKILFMLSMRMMKSAHKTLAAASLFMFASKSAGNCKKWVDGEKI